MKRIPSSIIISRADSIGDVVLTLPVATVLKKYFPQMRIAFIGTAYTRALIDACATVDEFIDVDDFMNNEVAVEGKKPEAILHVFPVAAIAWRAKKLRIPLRIGTYSRLYHLFTCNILMKLSRKNSNLHEAQLNLQLLKPLGISRHFSLEEIGNLFALQNLQPLPVRFLHLIDNNKYNLILHPKSQGNGREWGLDNFVELIRSLDKDRYRIFVSGTAKERALLQTLFDAAQDAVVDVTGLFDLSQFISFINTCDGLVANSTGPLHIAGALGKDALGIYPPIRPIHPGRWAALGPKAEIFVLDKQCNDCRNNKFACTCITSITPSQVVQSLDKLAAKKRFTL